MPPAPGHAHVEGAAPLAVRFREHWREGAWTEPGSRIVVACSGGLDSLVLLHLLRFEATALDLRVEAAHFDHRMRAESAEDAEWLKGLCAAWALPLHLGVAPERPADEAAARRLRYRFLERVLRENDARWVLTAHHEDDQIETVLFRILRGTGVRGLRGIPVSRTPGILRPLLRFTRAELEAYADAHFLRPRVDPTNVSLRFARNRVRHQLLPLLEDIHPGARASLLRLARNADRTVEALDVLVAPELDRIVIERDEEEIVLDRELLLGYPEALRGELLRGAADSVDIRLTEAGTAMAVQFMTTGSSGTRLDLEGGLVVGRDFDRLRLAKASGEPTPESRARAEADGSPEGGSLKIASAGSGGGTVELAGRTYAVRWGPSADLSEARDFPRVEGWRRADFGLEALSFPARVRGWRPGDRTRLPGGRRRKLKKVFREMRVPREERRSVPLLVDSEGLVVWVAGESRPSVAPGEERPKWMLGVRALEDA